MRTNNVKRLSNRYLIRFIRNLVFDLKYGGFLGGNKKTRYSQLGANNVVNTDYDVLPLIFENINIKKNDVIVDVGCGKGRVINWLLDNGIGNEIIGIELDEGVAEKTRARLKKYRNVKIIQGNILENIPENATIFYLYNPFNSIILEKFKNLLIDIFMGKQSIIIFYYCCIHLNVFQNDPNWRVEVIDLGGSFHQFAIIRTK